MVLLWKLWKTCDIYNILYIRLLCHRICVSSVSPWLRLSFMQQAKLKRKTGRAASAWCQCGISGSEWEVHDSWVGLYLAVCRRKSDENAGCCQILLSLMSWTQDSRKFSHSLRLENNWTWALTAGLAHWEFWVMGTALCLHRKEGSECKHTRWQARAHTCRTWGRPHNFDS